MSRPQKRPNNWPWYGRVIVALLVFIGVLSFSFLFVTSMSQNPDPRGQVYLNYQNEEVTLLVDWEAGATCWIVKDVGIDCLPLNDLNRDRLLGMMLGEPVDVTGKPGYIPPVWSQDEFPVTPEGER